MPRIHPLLQILGIVALLIVATVAAAAFGPETQHCSHGEIAAMFTDCAAH